MASNATASGSNGLVHNIIVWEWLNEHSRWRPYDSKIVHFLEQNTGKVEQVNLGFVSNALSVYTVDFKTMSQIRAGTGTSRPVRKKTYTTTHTLAHKVVWQFQSDTNSEWQTFEFAVCLGLHEAYSKGLTYLDLSASKFNLPYYIDFQNMRQVRMETGTARPIQQQTLLTPYPVTVTTNGVNLPFPGYSGFTVNRTLTSSLGVMSASSIIGAKKRMPDSDSDSDSSMPNGTGAAHKKLVKKVKKMKNDGGALGSLAAGAGMPLGYASAPGMIVSHPNLISSGSNVMVSMPQQSFASFAGMPIVTMSSNPVIMGRPMARAPAPAFQPLPGRLVGQHGLMAAHGLVPQPSVVPQPGLVQQQGMMGPRMVIPTSMLPTSMAQGMVPQPSSLMPQPPLPVQPGGMHQMMYGLPPTSSTMVLPPGLAPVGGMAPGPRIIPMPSQGSFIRLPMGAQPGIPHPMLAEKKADEVVGKFVEHEANPTKDEDCVICRNKLTSPSTYGADEDGENDAVTLKECRHCFHRLCLYAMYDSGHKDESLQCPTCKMINGKKMGNCPDGEMEFHIIPTHLPSYDCSTIRIVYKIREGIQGPTHPNPGKPYTARNFPRICYLPNNEKGKKVLQLLVVAWKRRLIFTVGTSSTTGESDTVTWCEIHHKTEFGSNQLGHGYPDPNYLDNVSAELASQGVTESDLTEET